MRLSSMPHLRLAARVCIVWLWNLADSSHLALPRPQPLISPTCRQEALKTMIELDGKLLLGRKVAIKRANEV